jgi:DNA-binding MarR family transcriptional regulator
MPEPIRLSELATALDLDLSTVSRQSRQLTDADLVTRTPDPADGRACLLQLNDRGRGVLSALRSFRRDALSLALEDWEPQDRLAAAKVMSRLAESLQPVSLGGPTVGGGNQ